MLLLRHIAQWVGSPSLLAAAVLLPVLSGLPWGYSEAWWTWLDRVVFMVTMWIALVVQAAQNRDTIAMQRKLDELIKSIDKADNRLQGLEEQ